MDFKQLYGEALDERQAEKRLDKLKAEFEREENIKSERVYSSSGRAEVLGNHTDHNHGKVMVAAISCDVLCCAAKRNDGIIKIVSDGYKPIFVNVNELGKKPEEEGTSTALVRGVASAIKQKGLDFAGFTAHCTSNVFKGAGVSSSAAFEVLIAEIINDMYLDGKLSPMEKAVVSQYAENVYFGKPCGLLDQSGIAIGSLTKLDFETPEKPVIEKLPKIDGYSFVITNTGGDHAKLTPHYAAIRKEMNEVAAFFNKSVLREVSPEQFTENIYLLKKKVSGRAILRAMHFFDENDRVDIAEKAVKSHDNATFLDCVNKSGLSSLTLLQNCSVPGDEAQPVVLGIETSRRIISDGAVRVHGGGFAGSILAVVSEKETERYIAFMKKIFESENVFRAEIRTPGTARID